jgi:hypothetical protein
MDKETQLSEEFGYWNEYPDYPAADWRHEISEDNTRLGYWAWVVEKINEEVWNGPA